jgi:hypothetical protein
MTKRKSKKRERDRQREKHRFQRATSLEAAMCGGAPSFPVDWLMVDGTVPIHPPTYLHSTIYMTRLMIITIVIIIIIIISLERNGPLPFILEW